MKAFGVSTTKGRQLEETTVSNGCNALFTGKAPHLTTGKLSGGPLADWNATPLIKSPLKQGYNNADDTSEKKERNPK
jgi:hypothetical protein